MTTLVPFILESGPWDTTEPILWLEIFGKPIKPYRAVSGVLVKISAKVFHIIIFADETYNFH